MIRQEISLRELQEISSKLDAIQETLLENKSVLTVEEVCRYTGLSKSYLYKLTSAGMIPHSKPIGKLVFFSKEEVNDWLLGRKRKGASEVEQDACNYLTFKNRSDARG